MKKLILLLTLIVLIVLSGCTDKPRSKAPDFAYSSEIATDDGQGGKPTEQPQSDVFFDIYSLYRQAIEERWDGSTLMKNNMSVMMLDCYGTSPGDNIGYTYADLDGNGKEEFVVALTDAFTDDYYGKLVLDAYTVNDNGNVVQLFSGGDRNRYYYAGGNLFANIGSSAASVEINTTLKLQGDEMIDTTTITKPANYQQLKLNLFS